MKPNFKLSSGTYTVKKFSSGELQVTTEDCYYKSISITGSVLSSDHIIELLQLVEAIRAKNSACMISLKMPYCAFSRQDRRCNEGEAFSLKVFADLLNSCNFTQVVTMDNHSDVSTALINNCLNIPVSEAEFLDNADNYYDYYVAPDAGAIKKIEECSKKYQVPMIRADKTRNTLTGEITGTVVYTDSETLDKKTVLIIDDICANGRTFLEIAKEMKQIQPSVTIHFYVTHGFFGAGLDSLKKAGISKFITTDSVCTIKDKDLRILSS